MTDLLRIRLAAQQFRFALEEIGAEVLPDSCGDFPAGSCGDTAPLLARYLTEAGLGHFEYVWGEKEFEEPERLPQSHAWLEQGSIIVDITADQFPEVSRWVLVTRDRTWHMQFKERGRHPAIDECDTDTANCLSEAYEKLKRVADAEKLGSNR